MPYDRSCLCAKLTSFYSRSKDIEDLYEQAVGHRLGVNWKEAPEIIWKDITADHFLDAFQIDKLIEVVTRKHRGYGEAIVEECRCEGAPPSSGPAPFRRVTEHLACDRADHWQSLERAFRQGGRPQPGGAAPPPEVFVVAGPRPEGHAYFVRRVREEAARLGAAVCALNNPDLPSTVNVLRDDVAMTANAEGGGDGAGHVALLLCRGHVVLILQPIPFDEGDEQRRAERFFSDVLPLFVEAVEKGARDKRDSRLLVLAPMVWRPTRLSFLPWLDPAASLRRLEANLSSRPGGRYKVRNPGALKPIGYDHVRALLAEYWPGDADERARAITLRAKTSAQIFDELERLFDAEGFG